jgi:hypothetical protein
MGKLSSENLKRLIRKPCEISETWNCSCIGRFTEVLVVLLQPVRSCKGPNEVLTVHNALFHYGLIVTPD